jgi:hypothetical protein
MARLSSFAHRAEVGASLFFAALAAFALRNIVANSVRAAGAEKCLPIAFSIAALFLFSLGQSENWLWGWQVAVFVNVAGTLVAIWLLSAPTLSFARVTAASAAATCAVYAFATGLALLPTGALILLLRHNTAFRWRALAVWTMFSIAVVLHYKIGVLDPARDYVASITPSKLDAATLDAFATYSANILGGAVGRFSTGLPIIMGISGVVLLVAMLFLAARSRIRTLTPAIGLLAYGTLAALLIAYGRLGFDYALGSRYITFANFFWIGLLIIMVIAAAKADRPAHSHAYVAIAALLVVCKIATMGNVVTSRFYAPIPARLNEIAAELCADYPTKPPELLADIASPQQNVAERIDFLAQHHLSFFRHCRNPRVQ